MAEPTLDHADKLERVEVRSAAELREWLKANHERQQGIWLVTFKKSAGDAYIPYATIVEEALCFGWIDSRPQALDENRSMRLLAPRRPGSSWSKINQETAEWLIAEGRMQPAGLAAIERAKADGSWSHLDAVEALEVPEDLSQALAASPPAAANFDAFPRSSKRLILEWIAGAKRTETRATRIAETARQAAIGQRANHYRQPKGK